MCNHRSCKLVKLLAVARVLFDNQQEASLAAGLLSTLTDPTRKITDKERLTYLKDVTLEMLDIENDKKHDIMEGMDGVVSQAMGVEPAAAAAMSGELTGTENVDKPLTRDELTMLRAASQGSKLTH